MENHLQREEIREAMASGLGESSRYSATLMQRSLYCASRLSDGSVIRLSVSHGSVLLLLLDAAQAGSGDALLAVSRNPELHRAVVQALVEDIISLSQLDEGGKDLAFSAVDLYHIVSGVVEDLGGIAAESGIRLTAEGERTVVNGVPELIRGIVYNLCDNAIKYNRPGGAVSVCVKGTSLIVKDTGIGIPPEHLDRIFERFYRVDKSHSKKVGGTGLGLSIVKHAARIHQAETKVESTVGEGTTVTVTFPKEDA